MHNGAHIKQDQGQVSHTGEQPVVETANYMDVNNDRKTHNHAHRTGRTYIKTRDRFRTLARSRTASIHMTNCRLCSSSGMNMVSPKNSTAVVVLWCGGGSEGCKCFDLLRAKLPTTRVAIITAVGLWWRVRRVGVL